MVEPHAQDGLLCPQALAIEHPAIQHIITVPAFSNDFRDVIHWKRRKKRSVLRARPSFAENSSHLHSFA
jgi:hypothetical protein